MTAIRFHSPHPTAQHQATPSGATMRSCCCALS
jgi:hypothetical protein